MKKLIVSLVFLMTAVNASANYTDTTGCTEKNRPSVLFALDRMAQEKHAAGQDDTAVLALSASISSNAETKISEQTLKDAGLNDAQRNEINGLLSVQE